MSDPAPTVGHTIGARIRQARDAAGMSQEALALPLNLSRAAVSQWETDSTRPDFETIDKLADLLGVSAPWLVFGQPKGTPTAGYEAEEAVRFFSDLFALEKRAKKIGMEFSWSVNGGSNDE